MALSAEASSRAELVPSAGQGPAPWLSLQSEGSGPFAGSDRELSVHPAASEWKLPTGVAPPDDSSPRDLSSSLWARSMSLSLLSLRVSRSMVWKMVPRSLRARPGCLCSPPPSRSRARGSAGQAGRLLGGEGSDGAPRASALESGGPAGMLT